MRQFPKVCLLWSSHMCICTCVSVRVHVINQYLSEIIFCERGSSVARSREVQILKDYLPFSYLPFKICGILVFTNLPMKILENMWLWAISLIPGPQDGPVSDGEDWVEVSSTENPGLPRELPRILENKHLWDKSDMCVVRHVSAVFLDTESSVYCRTWVVMKMDSGMG